MHLPSVLLVAEPGGEKAGLGRHEVLHEAPWGRVAIVFWVSGNGGSQVIYPKMTRRGLAAVKSGFGIKVWEIRASDIVRNRSIGRNPTFPGVG